MKKEAKLLKSNLVSVIVPVYNAEKHLVRCLESICNQSYKEFEVILVDDGSTDKSAAICDCLAEKDTRFKVFHKENEGVSSARNFGLTHCSGTWLSFVDADDILHPQYIEKMLEIAEKKNTPFVKCSYQRIELHSDYKPNNNYIEETEAEEVLLNQDFTFDSRNIFTNVWCSLIKRELANGVLFDESLYIGEDALFISEIFLKSKSVYYISTALYYYCIYEDSAFHNNNYSPKKNTDVIAWTKIAALYEAYPKAYNYCRCCIGICAFNATKRTSQFVSLKASKSYIEKMRKNAKYVINADFDMIIKRNYLMFCIFPAISTALLRKKQKGKTNV